MAIKARVRVVALFLLVLFLAPVVNLTRLQVLRSEELFARPDNTRTLEDLSLRGSLLDRTGQPLAQSREGRRVYPLGPITVSISPVWISIEVSRRATTSISPIRYTLETARIDKRGFPSITPWFTL